MFRPPYELFLALRYLRPKRTFVSIITLISIIGVTLGVAVLIIVISVMSGFSKQLRDKILGFNAHVRVVHEQQALRDYEKIRELVAKEPGVKGVAPYVLGQVIMQTQPEDGDAQVFAPYVKGISEEDEKSVSNVHTNLIAGSFDLNGYGVVIGVEMANQLQLSIGDRIAIQSPHAMLRMKETRGKEEEEAHLPDEYEIRGVYDVGYYEYNANIVIMSLENAQELYNLSDAVHGLMIILEDPFQADRVGAQLAGKLGEHYRITLWTEENEGILNALLVEKSVMFYLLFFIMIVAAFGIMNSLITFVVQKTREVGMLKALGATRGQVVTLFLSQSFIIGFIGVLSGFGLGMLALAYRNPFLRTMNKFTGLNLFPENIYMFNELPALIMPGDIALICGSALVICILAGAVPAYVASRLQPVEALRHE